MGSTSWLTQGRGLPLFQWKFHGHKFFGSFTANCWIVDFFLRYPILGSVGRWSSRAVHGMSRLAHNIYIYIYNIYTYICMPMMKHESRNMIKHWSNHWIQTASHHEPSLHDFFETTLLLQLAYLQCILLASQYEFDSESLARLKFVCVCVRAHKVVINRDGQVPSPGGHPRLTEFRGRPSAWGHLETSSDGS